MRSWIVAGLAWLWAGAIYASVALVLVFGLVDLDVIGVATGPLLATLGALLATRRPGNPIGFLLLLMATAYGVAIGDIVIRVAESGWGTGPGWVALLLFTNLFSALYILPVAFLLLLFPTGRPPGPGWRWLLRAGLGFAALWVILTLLVPSWDSLDGRFGVDNPLVSYSEDGWAHLEPVVVIVFTGSIVVLLLLSAVSLFARYRGAEAAERAQIRWLLYSGFLFFATFGLTLLSSGIEDAFQEVVPIVGALFYLSVLAIPVSIAIAILRHRLFDIDLIIRRTLQYGMLTAILGGVYVGSILLVRQLLGPVVGAADSPPVVMVTTLALAALFDPLRRRVQRFIDRRFYRRKVDAERAISRFAALARDEVDLQEIQRALFGVLGETLQPERMGLWIRSASGERSSGRAR